jgi:pimeloyl-ACP methyl ester carboxylesterase
VSDPRDIQILLLPGLGGDHRMALPQLPLPYSIASHDLVEMHDTETMEEYAARFLKLLLREKIIDTSRALFIGGFSFGSAVAQEISKMTRCNGVIIIGGLTSGKEFRDGIRYVGLHIIRHVPNIVFTVVTPFIRLFLRQYTKLSKSDADLCINMYRKFSKRLFREAYHLAAKWNGQALNCPMLRIHGAEDQIIRPPKMDENVILVATAKHLVNLSHAKQVNRSIQDFVDRTMRGTG